MSTCHGKAHMHRTGVPLLHVQHEKCCLPDLQFSHRQHYHDYKSEVICQEIIFCRKAVAMRGDGLSQPQWIYHFLPRKPLTQDTQHGFPIHQVKCSICTRINKYLSLANTAAVMFLGHVSFGGSVRAVNEVRHNERNQ